MVGNELEQEIIGLYNDDITALHSINEIAKKLGKAYPYINKKVNSLIEQDILKKTEVGRSHLCTVNLENDEAIWLLALNDIHKKQKLLEEKPEFQNILDRVKELKQAITIHLVLKTNEHLVFVVEGRDDKDVLEKSATLNSHTFEAHTKQEFLNKILDSKEILEDHTILYGHEKYYQYIREVKGPLRIKHSPLLQ